LRSSNAVGSPMIPLVDLAAQYASIKAEIGAAIDSVLEAQSFIQGPFVARFEAEFNAAHGARYGVGCSNGTAAIQLALEALGVGAGDEVITVPNTFIATVEAIVQVGARPVFVDIDARTHGIDGAAIEAAITPRTRAILPVHLFGNPCDMDAVMAVAARHKLTVVEDCAQAHLATYRGRHVGTLGDAGTFSFYPGKNLGAYGDAGHVFTRSEALDAAVRKLLDHGRMGKYEHDVIGANNRMDAIQAAVLSVKLRHLPAWTRTRREHAALYRELLLGSGAVPVQSTEGADPVHHLMVIEVADRDRVAEHLRANGIATGIHYPLPLHLQPALAYLEQPRGSFPVTERAAARILSLPLCGSLRSEQVEFIAAKVREVAKA
jgi:dTDP-4-amino-4,6-dideoxygalactose transaminase